MPETGTYNLSSNSPSTISKVAKLLRPIHGRYVVLDCDLAKFYGIKTTALNRAVEKESERFPNDFRFKLTIAEASALGLEDNLKNTYAYTELGIFMLSMVIGNCLAVKTGVEMVRAFSHNGGFTPKVFFSGQIYDAMSFLIELIERAKRHIVLIDGYVDINTLDILRYKRKNTSVHILTYPSSRITANEVRKFNSEYSELTVYRTTDFHDRMLILDDTELYHIGASLKDAGEKSFAITKLEEPREVSLLLERVANIVNKNASVAKK